MDDLRSNIEQRVFDAFPPHPHTITIYSIAAALPVFAKRSIYEAVRRLKERKIVEAPANRVYRLRKNAKRPIDMRGHHGRSGRKRRAR